MPNRRFSGGGPKRLGIAAEVLESGFQTARVQGRSPSGVTDTGMVQCQPAIVAETGSTQGRPTVLSTVARHRRKMSHNLLMRR